jgi:tetratricopeptide (TPR) repeat protein
MLKIRIWLTVAFIAMATTAMAMDETQKNEIEAKLRKAVSSAPNQGRHVAALGQFLLWNTNRFEETVACLDRALLLGYNRESVYRQKGWALHRMGRNAEAEIVLKECLRRIEAKLPQTVAPARAAMEKDLGVAAGFLALVLNEQERFTESVRMLERISSDHPDLRDTNMGRAGLPAALATAHSCFGDKRYTDALHYFQLASELAQWDKATLSRSLGFEIPLERELVRRRQALGTLKPDYVYRLAVILIARTDVDFVSMDGERVTGKRELLPRHRDKAKSISLSLARHWEAMSGGRLQVEVDFIEADVAVTGFHTRLSKSIHDKRLEVRSVDPAALKPSQADLFGATYKIYDTYVLIWNGDAGISTTSNGSWRVFPVGNGRTIRRGFVQISTDQLAFKMLLHEMSHNIEAAFGKNLAIDAGDGTQGNDRLSARKRAFPGCTAYTELAFNDCHFQNTLPGLLADTNRYRQSPPFANLNFRHRFAEPVRPDKGQSESHTDGD